MKFYDLWGKKEEKLTLIGITFAERRAFLRFMNITTEMISITRLSVCQLLFL